MGLAEICLMALMTGQLTWATIHAIEDLLNRQAYQPQDLEALSVLLDAIEQGEIRSPLAVSKLANSAPCLRLDGDCAVMLFFPEVCPSSTSR